jgi:hypothetical protein
METKERNLLQSPHWLTGGGEMGALIREFDWGNTPLGPLESWSPTLRRCVGYRSRNYGEGCR